MRKTGQAAKSHEPTDDAMTHANKAQYGDFSEQMIHTLQDLELLFRSDAPAKEIREAMTDQPQRQPAKIKNVKQALRVHRGQKIRAALLTLLCAVDERDGKFFHDMARFFSGANSDSNPVAADSLRLHLSAERFLQEHGHAPRTKTELESTLKADRTTLARAAHEVGLRTATGKSGRPRNTGN